MSTGPVISISREDAVKNAICSNNLVELQKLSLLPGGFGDAREHAWPYLLGVDYSIQSDTPSQKYIHPSLRHGVSNLPASSPSLGSSLSGSSGTLSLQESDLDGMSSQFFKDSVDLSPHQDEHQVQLDTDRSFVLYPVVDHSVAQRKNLQRDLHDVILGVLRKRPALRYFQGYHDIVTVLLLTLPQGLVLQCVEKLSLHRLRDSMGSGLEPLVGQLRILKRLLRMIDPSYADVLEKNSFLPYYALSNLLTLFAHDVPTLPLIQHVFDWLLCREPIASIWLSAAIIINRKEDILALEREGEEALGMMHAVLSALPLLSEDEPTSQSSVGEMRTHDDTDKRGEIGEEPLDKSLDSLRDETKDRSASPGPDQYVDLWTTSSPRSTSSSVLVSVDDANGAPYPDDTTGRPRISDDKKDSPRPETDSDVMHSRSQSQTHSHSRSTSRSLPGEYKEKTPDPLPLPRLLLQASELLAAYPPSLPSLHLSETFGSQSALHANGSAIPSILPSLQDDGAEACVGGDKVVLPLSQEEQEEEFGPPKKSKETGGGLNREKTGNRRPMRLGNGLVSRRQAVVAGVVLLLGVAVTLYGLGPGGRRNGSARFGSGDMKWMAAWMGGLLGVGERLGIGL